MKPFAKKINSFFLAAVVVSMFGCASTPSKESAGEYIDDTVITTKVKAAILDDPNLKASEINVETYKGVVQLSGFVANPDSAGKAVSVTSGVKGVKSVKNDIRVK